jgi:membrane dipeptidase
MTSIWAQLTAGLIKHGETIEVEGFMTVADLEARHGYFLLTPHQSCCLGCIPKASEQCIEVFMSQALPLTEKEIRLSGVLMHLKEDPLGWRFQLVDATLTDEQPEPIDEPEDPLPKAMLTRRHFLTSGALLGLAACSSDKAPPAMTSKSGTPTSVASIMDRVLTVDMHSHAGRVIPLRTERNPLLADDRPFVPLAEPMVQGRLAIVVLAVVADTPLTRTTGGRIEAVREPQPGELYTWANMAFDRLHRLIDGQSMGTITDFSAFNRATNDRPSAIVACEGADFLEGQIDRVDEFYQRKQLRHLQLVHYHINELGDIQTEPAKYGGLTEFGAAVIKRCNDVGIVVDVAHGPYDLVKRAAEVTSKPLVLSHTSLSPNPGPRSRLISPEHAKLVSGTGGVIGIWPPQSRFADIPAMAEGMARMADVVGVDHVGLGTDMLGLTGPSVLPSYADLPLLVSALIDVGFDFDDINKIMGGNYARVFKASVGHFFD